MIRPVPVRLQKRITEIGGLTPDGTKPLFRVVRSCDCFCWMGGRLKRFDGSGNVLSEHIGVEQRLKYALPEERYIFEMWRPMEYWGTEEQWEQMFTKWIDGQRVETEGPWPKNGEYDILMVIEKVTVNRKGEAIKREFAPLTDTLCDALVQTAKLNHDLPEEIKRKAIAERNKKEEEAKEQRLADAIKALERADFATKPHIISPGLPKEKRTPGGLYLP